MVIRGFKDNNEYGLQEAYAPVLRQPEVRAAIAITNKYDLDAYHLDVKTAFLNGTLKQEIYMKIPDGLGYDQETKKKKVCKIKKALYGVKFSPKRWNKKLTKEAKTLGLQNDLNEPCIFTWQLYKSMTCT